MRLLTGTPRHRSQARPAPSPPASDHLLLTGERASADSPRPRRLRRANSSPPTSPTLPPTATSTCGSRRVGLDGRCCKNSRRHSSPPDLRRPLSTSPPQVAAPRSGPFRAPALPGRPGPLRLVLPRCLSWEETGRGSWPWLHSGVSNTRAALAGHSCLSAGSLSLSPRLASLPSRVVPALRGVPTVRCEASLSGRASESADEGPSPSPTGRAPPALGFRPLPASPPLTASPPRGSFLWSPTIAVPTGPSSPWSLSS